MAEMRVTVSDWCVSVYTEVAHVKSVKVTLTGWPSGPGRPLGPFRPLEP